VCAAGGDPQTAVRTYVGARALLLNIRIVNALAQPHPEAKIDFLRRAESYPDRPVSVELVETHFAWVFLSRQFVYKLKKPISWRGLDLTTLAARRANCELEVSLNRRLATSVYVGVVPLVRAGAEWALEGAGEPADWLVKMRRLPREQTLREAAARGAAGDAELFPVVDKLASFYARTARAPWDGREYREHLAAEIEEDSRELAAPDLGVDWPRIRAVTEAQLRFIRDRASLLEARIAAGRVVDAHGDLRPEHVFLGDPPEIIDCLEFSANLRLLDTAEEIGFLALECERLGFGATGARIVELYRRRCADDVPPELTGFQRSRRALVRALLGILHLRDSLTSDAIERWRRRADWYLDAAEAAMLGALTHGGRRVTR
jgi:aminoglycoside phosphotransferase family enzyme